MTEQAVMEKLLQVLDRIEGRLVQIAMNTNSMNHNHNEQYIPATLDSDEAEVATRPRSTAPPDPVVQCDANLTSHPSRDVPGDHDDTPPTPVDNTIEEIRMIGNDAYFNSQANEFRDFAFESINIRRLYHGPEAQTLWTEYVGQLWSLPPDNRIDLSFQRHILETATREEVTARLEGIATWYEDMGSGDGVVVQDYDDNGQALKYELHIPRYSALPILPILEDPKNGSRFQRNHLKKFDFSSNHKEPK